MTKQSSSIRTTPITAWHLLPRSRLRMARRLVSACHLTRRPINPKTPVLPTGFANPTCNLYISYVRNPRFRTTTPTERLSLHSDFKRVNFVGEVSYSSGDLDSPYFEAFNGLVSRNEERQFTFSGPASVRRISVNSYAGVTVALTDKINLSDVFRYDNFQIPGNWNSVATTTDGIPVGTSSDVNVLLSPLGPTITSTAFTANFLGQKSFANQFQVEYTPSKFGDSRLRVNNNFRLRFEYVTMPEAVAYVHAGVFRSRGFDRSAPGPHALARKVGGASRPRRAGQMTLFILYGAEGFVSRQDGSISRRNILIPITSEPRPQPSVEAAASLIRNLQLPAGVVTLLHVGSAPETSTVKLHPDTNWTWNSLAKAGESVDIMQNRERSFAQI
jgi:hypothetical protein